MKIASLILVLFILALSIIKDIKHRASSQKNSLGVYTKTVRINPQQNPDFNAKNIFDYYDPEDSQTLQANPNEYTILATGDVLLARAVNAKMVKQNNFALPFDRTAAFLKHADISLINLETPLTSDCQTTLEGMSFCGSEKGIEGLKYAGIDFIDVANNHMSNQGEEGILNTLNLLKTNGFQVIGANKPAIINVRDKKFGFLGYNDIDNTSTNISSTNSEKIAGDILNLKKQVDFVIVALHWGVEYTASPSARQVKLAHFVIDNGADLIIGNHPHWVQGVEMYKNRFITYSHGNFIFDQMWSQKTREGIIGKYIFDESGLKDIKFFPVIIEDYWQPRFATHEEALGILEGVKQHSLLPF